MPAWPFSQAAPGDIAGPGATLPNSSTSVTTSQAYIAGWHFRNTSAAPVTVTITDTAGNVLDSFQLPVGGKEPYEPSFRPSLGVKWFASAASSVIGHIWGYA